MASKKDTLFDYLAMIFATFAFVGLLTFVFINLETYRVRREIYDLNGDPVNSIKEKLLVKIKQVSAEYSTTRIGAEKGGFKEKYADSYGRVHGVYPNYPEYLVNGAPKQYVTTKNGVEIQDSGLLKNIDRIRNSRQDESEEGDKYFRISKEEIIKQPAILLEQNKNIFRKIEEIGQLDKHIYAIKLEADDEIKKMRDDFVRMDNDLNVKVDEHLNRMSKKGLILDEMKTRLDILKRKNFNILAYDDFLKLSRLELDMEAEKEHLKNTKNLDHEQLAERVFQSRNIDGKVTNISDDRKTIIIDLGIINGLKVGQSFEVFELKNGVTKIVHGRIDVKEVNKFSSVCSPLIIGKKIPLIVPNSYVGDFAFISFQKSEFVLVGDFKSHYTLEELYHILKQKEGVVKKSIGYSTNYLVLGEKPAGEYPADEIADQMKDESLYYKKSISEIMVLYGFSEKVTEYAILFESAKEMGVKIMDEIKLLSFLSDK